MYIIHIWLIVGAEVRFVWNPTYVTTYVSSHYSLFIWMQSIVPSSRCLSIAPRRAALRPIARPSLIIVSATVVNSNDFRNGTAIEIDGVPYKVSDSGAKRLRKVHRITTSHFWSSPLRMRLIPCRLLNSSTWWVRWDHRRRAMQPVDADLFPPPTKQKPGKRAYWNSDQFYVPKLGMLIKFLYFDFIL